MKIKVSAISYLNTAPFVYGLENHPVSKFIEIDYEPPAVTSSKLINLEADLGLVPVAVIERIPNSRIITDYCIGAVDSVASVLLCSGCPVDNIETIYLDGESRSSVMLARVLAAKYWNIEPNFIDYNFSTTILNPNNSYIIIGDKALQSKERFKYVYDLAEEWIKFKSLPFVFACWVTNRDLPEDFIVVFNDALKFGIANINKSVERFTDRFDTNFAIEYLKKNISYPLTEDKRLGMSEFLRLISSF